MKNYQTTQFELTLEDNIHLMSKYPENHFDLAIVDPPYGIGQDWKKSRKGQFYSYETEYKNDSIPTQEYFDLLFKVSKNQIIWGGNYFNLPLTNSWICWDKSRDVEKTFMSEGELAWTSFKFPFRFYRHIWDGAKKGNETGIKRIHPHQKPISLYKWILSKYTQKGNKVLDTHLGSASIAIAIHELNTVENMNLHLTASEINKIHFEDSITRIKNSTSQLSIFQKSIA